MNKNEYSALTAMLKEARRGFLASIQAEERTPTEIIDREALLPDWKPGSYAVNDVRVHSGQVWRCCQAHDSTGNPGWEPGAVPALWAPYHTPTRRRQSLILPPRERRTHTSPGNVCFGQTALFTAVLRMLRYMARMSFRRRGRKFNGKLHVCVQQKGKKAR